MTRTRGARSIIVPSVILLVAAIGVGVIIKIYIPGSRASAHDLDRRAYLEIRSALGRSPSAVLKYLTS